MKLIIHAPNVHQGGGKTMLLAALQGLDPALPCTLITDTRLERSLLPPHVLVEAFPATLFSRFAAERRLCALAAPEDVVLCMGNLPPLLNCRGQVTVFLQNRYLCGNAPLNSTTFKAFLRTAAERLWLRLRLRPGMRLLVQTVSMQRAARQALRVDAEIVPFLAPRVTPVQNRSDHNRAGFLYPASADVHKNHPALLAAWQILKQAGIADELHLTVSSNAPLAAEIEKQRAAGVAVINHGELEPQQLAALYQSCRALVYPSRMESFGLPLLEAQDAGLPIIAAERDYVRDVVEPTETFDPDSPVSIARAVRRFLGATEKPRAPMPPAEFIRQVITARN